MFEEKAKEEEGSFCFGEHCDLRGLEINQFVAEAELGRGAQAVVVKAVKKGTDERVALKIVSNVSLSQVEEKEDKNCGQAARRSSLYGNGSKVNALKRELAVLRRVGHPSIVKFLEVLDLSCNNIAIAMEFVHGQELLSDSALLESDEKYWKSNSWMKKKCRYTEAQCRFYFCQIVAGLDYLHKNCILHGDIKPSNILLDQASQKIKIIDFGVSKIVLPDSKHCERLPIQSHGGFGAGTLAFLCPEMIQTSKSICDGRAVDLWAAVMTLHAILFGFLPLRGSTTREEIKRLLSSEATELPLQTGVGGFFHCQHIKCQDFLQKTLKKEVSKRVTCIAEIISHDWMKPVLPEFQRLNGRPIIPILKTLSQDDIDNVASPVWTSNLETFLTRAFQVVARISDMSQDGFLVRLRLDQAARKIQGLFMLHHGRIQRKAANAAARRVQKIFRKWFPKHR